MSRGTVEFQCGASFETTDAEGAPVGQQVLVFTDPDAGEKRPELRGAPAPCLAGCPCEGRHRTVKEFVTPAGGAGDLVVCKIIRCARIKE